MARSCRYRGTTPRAFVDPRVSYPTGAGVIVILAEVPQVSWEVEPGPSAGRRVEVHDAVPHRIAAVVVGFVWGFLLLALFVVPRVRQELLGGARRLLAFGHERVGSVAQCAAHDEQAWLAVACVAHACLHGVDAGFDALVCCACLQPGLALEDGAAFGVVVADDRAWLRLLPPAVFRPGVGDLLEYLRCDLVDGLP